MNSAIAAPGRREWLERFGEGSIFQLTKSILCSRADRHSVTTRCIQAEQHISAGSACLVLRMHSTLSHARLFTHAHGRKRSKGGVTILHICNSSGPLRSDPADVITASNSRHSVALYAIARSAPQLIVLQRERLEQSKVGHLTPDPSQLFLRRSLPLTIDENSAHATHGSHVWLSLL